MKVGEIMQCSPVTLQIDQTFGEAFHLLTTSRVPMVPVVDVNGVYQRNFNLSDIWAILLPKAVKLSRNSLEDLSYVSGSFEKMKDQLTASATLPIRQFLSMKDAPILHPESSVMQAILLFDEYRETLPVIDRQTRELVGVVSGWELLDALEQETMALRGHSG